MASKLNKIAQQYHAAAALSDNAKMKDSKAEELLESPKEDTVEEEAGEESPKKKKPSRKLDFNENRGGLHTTIYKGK